MDFPPAEHLRPFHSQLVRAPAPAMSSHHFASGASPVHHLERGSKTVGSYDCATNANGASRFAGIGGFEVARPFTKQKIEAFFERLKAQTPEPKTELAYTNPFTLLVAVVLSAQTTDRGVNKATESLFPFADTPGKMLRLGEEKLIEHIRTIGLYRNKAKNVIALSRILVEQHEGRVPCDRDALEALPGVGRKTANVVLNVAFGQPTIAVDTHIFRVANRTGLAPGKTPLDVEARLASSVPQTYRLHAHHWLILHGRYICVARRPRCPECVVSDLCRYPHKTRETDGDPRRRSTRR
jgi:endonuclease-3